MIDQSNDKTLYEWIQRDLAENLALAEYCDIEDVLDTQPKPSLQLLPKFRIESLKKMSKPRKKTKFSIEDSKIEELSRNLEAIKIVTQEIEQEEDKITRIKVRNAEAKRDLLERKQNLNKIRTSAEDTKLEQLKKLEEARLIQEQVKKEENRSRKARSQISQKRIEAEEEFNQLNETYNQMVSDFKEFKRKRERNRKSLQEQITECKADIEQLKKVLMEIEHQL